MQFGYTILYVEDVKATIEFYEKAFGLSRRFLQEGQYGELETGTTRLAFAQNTFAATMTDVPFETAALAKPAPPAELAFCTDDIETAFRKALDAGAVEVSKAETKPWGQTVSYVRDLNGFLIEICTPIP
jgi:lactoylglutathione lyase